jgi:predicted nucleic acid-binding Zn ribbon protein
VIPIQQVMPDALAAVLKKAPLTPEKVAFAWRSAVGAAVANVTTVALRERVLHVVARDRTWQREVKRSTPFILARLKTVLGDEIARLDVTAAPAPGQSAGESGSARRRR